MFEHHSRWKSPRKSRDEAPHQGTEGFDLPFDANPLEMQMKSTDISVTLCCLWLFRTIIPSHMFQAKRLGPFRENFKPVSEEEQTKRTKGHDTDQFNEITSFPLMAPGYSKSFYGQLLRLSAPLQVKITPFAHSIFR